MIPYSDFSARRDKFLEFSSEQKWFTSLDVKKWNLLPNDGRQKCIDSVNEAIKYERTLLRRLYWRKLLIGTCFQ